MHLWSGRFVRVLAAVAGVVSLAVTWAAPARAQTWSSPRGRPVLWQIVAIDESGETGWPYGGEDVAGDGLDSFDAEEAGADLRTVYADADAERLWIRAYVASESAPSASVIAYFFLDSDDRDGTGGDADSDALWPELTADPSAGGYERAIAARGDGTLGGAWRWDTQAGEWTAIAPPPPDDVVEIDRDLDPIRIGGPEHGYLQLELDHDVSGLDASCDGNIFVRMRHDGDPPARAFGDDDEQASACRLATDAFGDPIVLREPACSEDSDCPADGRCREGVCLFAYDCSGDDDCRTGEQCSAGACVRVVERSCGSDADCDGLVCADGDCAACAESGARACAAGLLCSPNGGCVDPEADPIGGGGSSGGAGGGSGAAAPGTTRGGAFHCAAARVGTGGATLGAFSLAFALATVSMRMRRRRSGARSERRAPSATRSP
jgi:hypothetical protein